MISLLCTAWAQDAVSTAVSYRITTVTYTINGNTKEKALQKAYPIDTNKVFTDEAALLAYIEDIKIRLASERNFSQSRVDFIVTGEEPDYRVSLTIEVTDTSHFIAVPYPKYNSNSGITLKLKIKDSNFLGNLKELSSDLFFAMEKDDHGTGEDTDTIDKKIGFSIAFEIPVYAGNFEIDWINDWQISYILEDSSPQWNATTGLQFTLPFDRFALVWLFKQGAVRNWDYKVYDDDTYFTEFAQFAVPITVQTIDNWGDIILTPYTNITYIWDNSSISAKNEELMEGPVVRAGGSVSTKRVDWYGNFRRGASIILDSNAGYNTDTQENVSHVGSELQLFTSNSLIGVCIDVYGFYNNNYREKIGTRLRGIRDDQLYAASTAYGDTWAVFEDSACILNLDIPFHLFTFDFDRIPSLQRLHIFNCEVQASPFIDIALTHNRVTDRWYSYKDGYYSGGLEILVFPQKWRSLVVRGSIGFDIGRLLLDDIIDTTWRREKISKHEIEIGIGLHF
ncbi:MAG: DUF4312 family protein [Treponema sp.]|nr:DUF4312 family protein [Treponema sp.]